jgi:hypothetical protein
LGERGAAGGPKTLALNRLDALAERVQGRAGYKGEALEDVIGAVEATLSSGENMGSVENFDHGVQVVSRIVARLQERGLHESPDMARALRALDRLGVLALAEDFDHVVESVLDLALDAGRGPNGLFQRAAEVMFHLGVKALDTDSFHFAAATLNRMESLCAETPALTPDVASDYLGLLAHFWAVGATSQGLVRQSLEHFEFEPSLAACLQEARQYHFRRAQFKTSDLLIKMQRGLRLSEPAA